MSNNNHDNRRNNFQVDKLKQAERDMYPDNMYTATPGHFDPESMVECGKDLMQYYNPVCPFDNNRYLVDQVVDARILKNHEEWVQEITPWAGTAFNIGSSEFNPGDYINFVGLRRPRGVHQDENMFQITEVDESNLSGNQPFTF
jgi:hypothetical protein